MLPRGNFILRDKQRPALLSQQAASQQHDQHENDKNDEDMIHFIKV